MFRVLAIEPDADRRRTLERLVRDRVGAEVVVADSADQAVASLSWRRPDVILTSLLVPPQDEELLMSHLRRQSDAEDLPVLTIPPLVYEDENPRERGRIRSWLGRRPAAARPTYDADAVSERIREALEEVRTRRARRQLHLVNDVQTGSRAPVGRDAAGVGTEDESGAKTAEIVRKGSIRYRRAHRWTPADLPWLSGARTPWGVEVEVVNISTSGMLVLSPSKLMPGTATDLTLLGAEQTLIVRARFVRTEVAAVDSRGVKYQAAAVFDSRLTLLPDRPVRARATPQALAQLLVQVTDELGKGANPAAARTTFERGLRGLIEVSDIQIRAVPVVSLDGSDSVYFTIPTGSGERAILQATFPPSHEPAEEEFRLLKAAATMAGVVVQFEEVARHSGRALELRALPASTVLAG